ncbi:hypothetical protein TeGR_g11969 [Tetraparma gracilis]|uniref:SAP domain-containing protein n=1 Tax=Tetraparma gracilis TaxID=2962635 RepID=A0ABQ6MW25_9STRA|nr:hypothetical protein TeGR_g11969 [Tetraparma gracilis]
MLSSASMTVPELKALLRSRGLPASGKKAELLLRLDGAPSAPPPHPLSNLPPRAVKGWEVADVQELAGCGKVRAEKGSLVVWGGGGEELYRVGPEARPFPMLGAADWEAVAQEVKGKLA